MIIDFDGKNFQLECSFRDNAKLHAIPNKRFNKRTSKWVVPPYRKNVEAIVRTVQDAKIMPLAQIAIDNTRKIRVSNLKFPIWYKPKTTPMMHQKEGLDFVYGKDAAALFMEMGTGKTKIGIDWASVLYMESTIDRVLVICPYSIRGNWVDEIKIHGPLEYRTQIIATSTKKMQNDFAKFMEDTRSASKKGRLPVAILGVESVSQGYKKGKAFAMAEDFVSGGKVLVVVDESHFIKTHNANRSENVVWLGNYAVRKLIMTGTPLTQSPLDLYTQFQFLDPDIIGIGSWYAFRNQYAVLEEMRTSAGSYQKEVGYKNIEELAESVGKFVFQSFKKDVLDLPDKVYETVKIAMSKEQSKIYKSMARERIAFIKSKVRDGGPIEIVADNILVSLNFLQQIASGFVMTKVEGQKTPDVEMLMAPKSNPKIREMLRILEELDHSKKVIIWTKYRRENLMVADILRENFGPETVSEFHGGLTGDQRQDNMKWFKRHDGTRFFVATLQTGSVGLTLNESDLVIYFSNSFKFTDRIQSEDRNHRIGQKNSVLYIDLLIENSVEEQIRQAIKDKKSMSDYVAELIAEIGIDKAAATML